MHLSRRDFVAAGALGLAGCSHDPRRGTPSTSPGPGPSPAGTRTDTSNYRTATDTDGEGTPQSGPLERNFIFVDDAQLREQQRKVDRGKQPYKAAYEDLLSNANRALNKGKRSVTDNGNTCNSGNPHRWCHTDDRSDYVSALKMGRWARDCGLAYWFTGEDKYAEQTIALVHHWFLDSATYQAPNAASEKHEPLQQFLTIPSFIYGASFVRGHPAWDTHAAGKPWSGGTAANAERAFEDWCREWVRTFPDPGYYLYNNKWAWRIQAKSAAAVYLQDEELLTEAFCMWRGKCNTADEGRDAPRPWNHWREEDGPRTAPGNTTSPAKRGYFKRPLSRNDGWIYTYFTFQSLLTTAEIARHQGIDLYAYNAPVDDYPGKTLKKSLDWGLHWAHNPSDWQWGHGTDGHENSEVTYSSVPYELAHRAYGDPAYLDAIITTDNRPIRGWFVLGPVTLTHGVG